MKFRYVDEVALSNVRDGHGTCKEVGSVVMFYSLFVIKNFRTPTLLYGN